MVWVKHLCKGVQSPTCYLRRHLLQRIQFAKDGSKFFGRPPTLPLDVDKQLVKYLFDTDRMLLGLSRKDLMCMAYQLAERNNLQHDFNKEQKSAGKDWSRSCMGRHLHVTLRQAGATSLLRATAFNAFNKKAVDEFFEHLENVIDRYKLTAGSIYNMDETP